MQNFSQKMFEKHACIGYTISHADIQANMPDILTQKEPPENTVYRENVYIVILKCG